MLATHQRLVTGAVLLALSVSSAAHVIELGSELVRGACPHVRNVEVRVFPLITSQQSRIVPGDGMVALTAIVLPERPLPGSRATPELAACAKTAWARVARYRQAEQGSERTQEDAFVLQMNACLAQTDTRIRVTTAVLQRSGVQCPAAPQEPLVLEKD